MGSFGKKIFTTASPSRQKLHRFCLFLHRFRFCRLPSKMGSFGKKYSRPLVDFQRAGRRFSKNERPRAVENLTKTLPNLTGLKNLAVKFFECLRAESLTRFRGTGDG